MIDLLNGDSQSFNDLSNLTKNQLLIWMDQTSRPDVPLYNMIMTFEIAGEIDREHFRRAFQALLDKSDALRIVIERKAGIPQQRVLETLHYDIEYLDFSESSRPENVLDEWVMEDCMVPFTLGSPLINSALIKLADHQFVWYLKLHHVIFDGWSYSLIYRRMSDLYESAVRGVLDEIPDYPSFMEYVENEKNYRRSQAYREAENYWTEKLSRRVEPLQLYGRTPLSETSRVARVQCDMGRERTEKLKALALEKDLASLTLNLSLFHILSALVFAYLYRISGNRFLSIGVPFHNRSSVRLNDTIGLLMEVAPLQVEISEGDTFVSLVKKVMVEASNTLRHYRYSPGNPVNNKAYEVVLNFQNVSYPDFARMPVKANWPHSGYENEKIALQIHDFNKGGSFVIEFDFDTEIFDETQRSQAISHFLGLVDTCLENKSQLIDQISLLTIAERKQILEDFSRTEAALPTGMTVVQLFEAQAHRTPKHFAVVHESQSLTYEELNRRSNQLAHHLRSLGVRAETLVGICVERSLEMIVGILGILKAGGAYVPLDPAYPSERLTFIIGETQTPVLLTLRRLEKSLPEHRCQVIFLDEEWNAGSQAGAENPALAAAPGNLAYIIYTSGSTGQPKGVMITHDSLANYTEYAGSRYSLESNDRALQFASINFDTSAEEIYPCLTHGATLVLRNESMIGSAATFLETCKAWQITILNLPTAYWHELVNGMEAENLGFPPATRLVIIGGEKASPKSLDTWHRCVNQDVCLMNTYGPTESTIVATMAELTRESALAAQRELAIGLPVGNVQIFVLDSNFQPVPIGAAGELYIGGAGLARGYYNAPELTAQKFVPNPFADTPGARLYKTGDLVRLRPDGNVEFVGRVDHQVKIRGFRIELGEIESVIDKFPGVQKSLVMAKEPIPNHKRLVVYLVTNNGTAADGELRNYLKERLPDYMLPTVFVPIDSFPQTPSGKVDRKGLPEPDWTNTDSNGDFEAPRTSTEKALADIWTKVLRIDRVGLHDNFFELGGDSILSIQVIAKANHAGIQLTIANVIQHQTIAELARAAGKSVKIIAEQGVVTGPVLLTPYQHWFFEQDLPESHHWNIAILLEIREKLKYDLIPTVLQHLVAHHDALRLRFFRDALGWRQINAAVDEADQELAQFVQIDLSALSAAEQEASIEKKGAEHQASLDMAKGPLISVVLFELGAGRPDRLLMIVHHMVIDGISFRILLEDFETAYRQMGSGETISLPAKTTSYKQWAHRLTEYAQSESLVREIDYWLKGYDQNIPRLPVDYEGGANTSGATRAINVCLTAEETRTLLQRVPMAYNTQINDVLLTAMILAFSEWTHSRALLFDLEGHGREDIMNDIDFSRTIGCFTALFPVMLNLERTNDLGNQLMTVKETLRSIPKHGIGYGMLRYLCEQSGIAEKLQTQPQAEVSFNYLGQFDQVLPPTAPLALVEGSFGPERSPSETRHYLLEILGRIVHNRLQLELNYCENIHRCETIERLAEGFIRNLRSLIGHCTKANAGGYTPSDFPAANLDQRTLDLVLAKLNS